MADLSTLSDEELLKLAGQAGIKPQAAKAPVQDEVDLSSIPDDELKALAFEVDKPDNSGFLDVPDKYTGAPARAATSELLRTDNEFAKPKPSFFGNLVSAGKAFANQFGKDPALAPTGKDIATKRLGISDKPFQSGATSSFAAAKSGIAPEAVAPEQITKSQSISLADIVGAGIDVLADPTNVIPVGTLVKAGGKAGKFALKGSAAALEAMPIAGPVARGTGKAVKSAEKAINSFVNPKRADNFSELAEIAAKNGIDLSQAPEALEFGKNSFISRASRVQAEGPLGEQRLEGAVKFFQDTTNAFDKRLADASAGEILTRTDAGQHLRDSFDNAISNLFKENEVRYSTIAKQNPNLPIDQAKFSELNNYLITVAEDAQKAIRRGFSPAQTQQSQMLLNNLDAIWKEGATLDGAIDVLQNLGEVAFPKGGQGLTVGPDLKRTRELYFKLRDTIIDSIETTLPNGKALAGELRKSNKNISQFMKTIEPVEGVLANKNLAPEQVFDRLTKSTSQIEALKSVLAPQDFAKLKGAYLDGLTPRSAEGLIQFGSLRNKLGSRANSEVIQKLFSPEELADLADIGKLAESAGNPIMSTSGTGASNSFLGMVKDLPFRVAGESVIESQKARARGLTLPKQAKKAEPPRFGPKGISAKEAIGLRLPQQIIIKEKNKDKDGR